MGIINPLCNRDLWFHCYWGIPFNKGRMDIPHFIFFKLVILCYIPFHHMLWCFDLIHSQIYHSFPTYLSIYSIFIVPYLFAKYSSIYFHMFWPKHISPASLSMAQPRAAWHRCNLTRCQLGQAWDKFGHSKRYLKQGCVGKCWWF